MRLKELKNNLNRKINNLKINNLTVFTKNKRH